MKSKLLLVSALFLAVYITNAQNTCTPLITSGLVGYYPFCGNANDVSGSSNNGTLTGASPATDRFGNSNSAYSFNGTSDYIKMPSGNSTTLDITGDFSVSYWFKTSQASSLIISLGDNVNSNSGGYLTGMNAGNVGNGKMGFATKGAWHGSTKNTLNDNQWHNAIVTLKKDTMKIYIDNILDAKYTGVASPLSWNGTRALGCRNDYANGFYQGVLDDIYIFNRAITTSEINTLYTNNSPCTPDITSNLIAEYDFKGNANDLSGNNNNGTVNGATLTADRFGNANRAYSFNGTTDNIDCGIKSSTIFANGVSFCAWINPTMENLSSVVDRIQNTGSGFRINTRDIANGQTIWAQADNYTNGGLDANSITQYKPNQWLFITGTWSTSDSVKIYINGKFESSTTVKYDMSSPYPILIGIGQRSLNYEPFQGDIDDVRIYARALKDCDVDSLYKLPNPLITGVSEKNENKISIYPNPAKNIINIKGNNLSGATISIYNSLGQIVLKTNATNAINTSGLKEGLYFLQIINQKGIIIHSEKIIKE